MTHTLNRLGLTEEKPEEEYIILCMAHQKEKAEKADAMKKVAQTIFKYKPDNFIGAPNGFTQEDVIALAPATGIVTAVFTNKEDVLNLLKDIKSQHLGISVVLSGLFKDINHLCRSSDLREHTFHISLGIYGKTENLPDEKTLEITTQCGHGLISPHLVKHIAEKISKGKMTTDEGARMLVKPCVCGIGNPKRIEKILDKIV